MACVRGQNSSITDQGPIVSFSSPPHADAAVQATRARSGSKGRTRFFVSCPIPQFWVLHNKIRSQRNQSGLDEVVGLNDSAASRQDDDGDSECLMDLLLLPGSKLGYLTGVKLD